jgi:hypothetical protein
MMDLSIDMAFSASFILRYVLPSSLATPTATIFPFSNFCNKKFEPIMTEKPGYSGRTTCLISKEAEDGAMGVDGLVGSAVLVKPFFLSLSLDAAFSLMVL